MNFTVFSIMMSLIWVSIFAKVISVLRKQMYLLRCFSIYPLIFLLLFCVIRLLFAFELPYTKLIRSKVYFAMVQRILNYPMNLFGVQEIIVTPFLILLIIWTVVAINILCTKIYRYYRLRCLFQFLPASEDERLLTILTRVQKMLNIKKKVKIVVHEEIQSPAIVGFFVPILILPQIYFSDEELLGVFLHELAHSYYGHSLIKAFGIIVETIFWWNPVFKRLSTETEHALEMQADAKISMILSREYQYTYLDAINKVAKNIGVQKLSLFSCGLVEENHTELIDQRFKMILEQNYTKSSNVKKLILAMLTCLLFFASYTFVFQPYSEPTAQKYDDFTEVSDDAYLVEEDGGYILYSASGEFIANIKVIDESLIHLKIKKMEDLP